MLMAIKRKLDYWSYILMSYVVYGDDWWTAKNYAYNIVYGWIKK